MSDGRMALQATLAVAFLVFATVVEGGEAARQCTVSHLRGLTARDVTLTIARLSPATREAPEFCEIAGTIETHNNHVTFVVGLPSSWNQKLLMAPQGGFGGDEPRLNTAWLAQGYATGANDMGHTGVPPAGMLPDMGMGPRFPRTFTRELDSTWALHAPEKTADFGYRAQYVAAVTLKALVQRYYGAPAKRAILNGCSGGGRSAMMMAQRYPDMFDGYIAGAPAFDWMDLVLGQINNAQALYATKASWLPPAKSALLGKAVLAACDKQDGLADSLVEDPRRCGFDPAVLECPGGDRPDCFNHDQVRALHKMMTGMRNKAGEQITQGWPLTGEEGSVFWNAWIPGVIAPPIDADGRPNPPPIWQSFGFAFGALSLRDLIFEDPAYDWRDFEVTRDLNRTAALAGQLSALSTHVAALREGNRKLILYQPWADGASNPLGTIKYYEALEQRYGQQVRSTVRLFMVPGMGHCVGGTYATDQFDMVAAMEQWLDTDVAPDTVPAVKLDANGEVVRSRPLCAYPNVVALKPDAASVDPLRAENLTCVAPPP